MHWVLDELGHQGHLLDRHNKRLKCKACNVYRADRQFNFWNVTPCVPRPCAADVVSRFRKKEKIAHQRFHRQFGLQQVWFSTVSFRVTSTSTRLFEISGLDSDSPDSLDVRFTAEHAETICQNLSAHVLQANPLCFLSRKMCMTCSCKSLWLIQMDPELRCGLVLTTQMDGNHRVSS